MKFPERMTTAWIASLSDKQLATAEHELRAKFTKQEGDAKKKLGADYDLMRAPQPLFTSWMSWSIVNNAAQKRGVFMSRK